MYVAIPQPYNSKFTLRKANKSSLADALWNHMPDNTPLPKITIQYILSDYIEVPYLIESLCVKEAQHEETCKHQLKYVNNHYGTPIVVLM